MKNNGHNKNKTIPKKKVNLTGQRQPLLDMNIQQIDLLQISPLVYSIASFLSFMSGPFITEYTVCIFIIVEGVRVLCRLIMLSLTCTHLFFFINMTINDIRLRVSMIMIRFTSMQMIIYMHSYVMSVFCCHLSMLILLFWLIFFFKQCDMSKLYTSVEKASLTRSIQDR